MSHRLFRDVLEGPASVAVPWPVHRRLERLAFAVCRLRDGPVTLPVASGAGVATVAAMGDIALHAFPPGASRGRGDALAAVRPLLESADLRTANLETVLSRRGRPVGRVGTFLRAEPESVEVLLEGGIDVITCANNHCTDYGSDALHESVDRAREAGIEACGVGETPAEARRAVIRDVRGVRVGLLGYCDDWRPCPSPGYGPAGAREADMLHDVGALRDAVDIVILHLHWGWEWAVHPLRSHRDLARRLADAGADLVLCHHAHVPMAVEVWGRSVIAHGLGNFVFPRGPAGRRVHPWRERSFVLHVDISPAGVHEARVEPVEQHGRTVRPSIGGARREMLGGLAVLREALRDTERLAALERERMAREGYDLAVGLRRLLDRGDDVGVDEVLGALRLPRGRALIRGLADLPDRSGAPLGDLLDVADDFAELRAAGRDGRLDTAVLRLAGSTHRVPRRRGRIP